MGVNTPALVIVPPPLTDQVPDVPVVVKVVFVPMHALLVVIVGGQQMLVLPVVIFTSIRVA